MTLDSLGKRLSDYPSTKDALSTESIEHTIEGVGTSRIVIQHPKDNSKAVKFGVGLSGYRQNKTEVKVYQAAVEYDVDDVLVPVLEYAEDYSWIVMPLIDCPEGKVGKVVGPKAKDIRQKLAEEDIFLYELETVRHEGSVKAYDYGSTQDKI